MPKSKLFTVACEVMPLFLGQGLNRRAIASRLGESVVTVNRSIQYAFNQVGLLRQQRFEVADIVALSGFDEDTVLNVLKSLQQGREYG